MTLFFIILISIILDLLFLITFIKCNFLTIKSGIKFMFQSKNEDYTVFNTLMFIMMFMVIFIATSATYNTYIDKNNPHY